MENTGIFSMDVVHQILAAKSLGDAKNIAVEKITEYSRKIKEENVKKAKAMIAKAKNLNELAFGMSNFILAFQGEKVIK